LLWLMLPESVRFLASKNRRPELLAATLNRLAPDLKASASDRFELGDERKITSNFRVSQLFEGQLRWITPLLWIGYTISSLAIYFSSSWGPLVLEAMEFPRNTAAYVASISGLMGAIAGLALMRFTDRYGPFSVAFYPLLAIPFLLVLGLVDMTHETFLPLSIVGTALVGGAHFGVVSIAGVFYPSAIRANGAGWATSIAKAGAIVGPLIGAAVLASGVPAVRTFALLAVCPAVLALSAIGIGIVLRRRSLPAHGAAAPQPAE
jgi:AAHS family 4-hydroxybenzoate transporter-like MFS transporter